MIVVLSKLTNNRNEQAQLPLIQHSQNFLPYQKESETDNGFLLCAVASRYFDLLMVREDLACMRFVLYESRMDGAIESVTRYCEIQPPTWHYETLVECMVGCIERGHIAILEWLLSMGFHLCHDAWSFAVSAGTVDMLRWLSTKQNLQPHYDDILHEAVRHGQIGVIEWLLDERGYAYMPQMIPSLTEHAIIYGHPSVLQFLQSRHYAILISDDVSTAARSGHLDVVRWLREKKIPRCRFKRKHFVVALTAGNLDVTDYIYSSAGPFVLDAKLGICAAEKGRLDILRWLKQKDAQYAWSVDAFRAATRGGHLQVLKYLYKQGCKTRLQLSDVSGLYFQEQNTKVLQWLWRLDDDTSFDKSELARFACETDCISLLEFIHRQRYVFTTPLYLVAIENRHINVLLQLHKYGCPIDDSVTSMRHATLSHFQACFHDDRAAVLT